MFGKDLSNKIDPVDDTLLRLSNDIGAMAQRIGEMADRIGVMADRIVETQRIQGENLQRTQEAQIEMLRIMNQTLKDNHVLMAELLKERDR